MLYTFLLLFNDFREQGFVFARLDGTMRAADRAKAVHDFANPVPGGPTIFLLSLKAGGVGINLTAASRVFLLDPVRKHIFWTTFFLQLKFESFIFVQYLYYIYI